MQMRLGRDPLLLALAQSRRTHYTYELLDSLGNLKAPLRTVEQGGGSLEYAYDATLKSGGKLTFRDLGEQDVDWVHDRIRVSVEVTPLDGPDREPRTWRLGVFIPTYDTVAGQGGMPVELHSRLVVLDEDALVDSLTLPAGTVATDAILSLIESNGEAPGIIEPSTATLPYDLVWEAGTSLLRVANDLLIASGFLVLNTSPEGQFRASPYVAPHLRPIRYTFQPGIDCIYTPEWTHSQDTFFTPNRVVATAMGDADDEGLVGVATNEDPTSPFSYPNRGRWITKVFSGIEAASQSAINTYALRQLVDYGAVTVRATLRHLVVPLETYDAIQLLLPDGTSGRFVVDRTEIDVDAGGLTTTTLRQVTTYDTGGEVP
jgi:hypothetical protein